MINAHPDHDSFYMRSFKRRFSNVIEYQNQILPVLELILAAPEPVPIAVLAGATNREVRQIRLNLIALNSIVEVESSQEESNPDWSTVRFINEGFVKWLTSFDEALQPLAGPYTAKANIKGLAEEVLHLWRLGETSFETSLSLFVEGKWKDALVSRKAFVARTLWALLKDAGNKNGMDEAAFDLSLHWMGSKPSLAIEPAEHVLKEILLANANDDDPGLSLIRGMLHGYVGDILYDLGQNMPALDAYRAMSETLMHLYENHQDQFTCIDALLGRLIGSHTRIGDVLERQGCLDEALKEFRISRDIVDRQLTRNQENIDWYRYLCISCNRLGGVFQRQGCSANALEQFRKMLWSAERLITHNADKSSWWGYLYTSHNRIGAVFQEIGDLITAKKEFMEGLAIAKKLASVEPESEWWQNSLATAWNNLGVVHFADERFKEARKCFDISKSIAQQLASYDQNKYLAQEFLWESLICLGRSLEALGDLIAALKEYHSALKISEKLLKKDYSNIYWLKNTACTLKEISHIEANLGKPQRVFKYWCREASLVLHALTLDAPTPSTELRFWKDRARELADLLPKRHCLVNELESASK